LNSGPEAKNVTYGISVLPDNFSNNTPGGTCSPCASPGVIGSNFAAKSKIFKEYNFLYSTKKLFQQNSAHSSSISPVLPLLAALSAVFLAEATDIT